MNTLGHTKQILMVNIFVFVKKGLKKGIVNTQYAKIQKSR